MSNKSKKALILASLSVIFVIGLAFFFVRKNVHSGSYEFAAVPQQTPVDVSATPAIPVAPGPATPGPEALSDAMHAHEQGSGGGVPVIVNGQSNEVAMVPQPGANRQPAMAVDGGIANNPHGVDHHVTSEGGVPVMVNGEGASASAPSESTNEKTGKGAGTDLTEVHTGSSLAKAPEPTCFTFTYKHKATAGHDSEESCSHHKNLIHLAHKNVNPSSLCVRVNGKAVHFSSARGKPDDIVIGAVAGPKATITASYCTGTVKCAQSCKVAKDEFLDAIGGAAAEGEDSLAMGQWQAQQDGGENDKKLVANMKKEISGIDGQEGTGDGYTLFPGWIADAGTPSCGGQTAQNDSKGE